MIRTVVLDQSNPKLLLSFGLLGALWSASGFIGAFTRASNAIYGVTRAGRSGSCGRCRSAWPRSRWCCSRWSPSGLIVSGPVTDAVGDLINAGGLARTAWSVAKWPVLAMIMMVAAVAAVLDRAERAAAPVPLAHPGRRGGPGLLGGWPPSASASTWPTSARTTPPTAASGAAIAFLVWLYLSNSALMLGVQINAEVQRGRQLQAGDPDPEEPVLPPRKPADD